MVVVLCSVLVEGAGVMVAVRVVVEVVVMVAVTQT